MNSAGPEGQEAQLPAGCCRAHAAAAAKPSPSPPLAFTGPTGSQWLRPSNLQEALQVRFSIDFALIFH